MTRWVWLVFAACWTTPRPPVNGPIPGLVWISPEQPFRVPVIPNVIAGDGRTALIGGGHGFVGRLDLVTGKLVRERRIREVNVQELTKLADGRWLVLGGEEARLVAFTLDPETLEPTPVELGAASAKTPPYTTAELLPDGSVAIVAPGLPLATYDPKTWRIRRVLHSSTEWNQLQARGRSLYGVLGNVVYRIDLATGAQTRITSGIFMQAAPDLVAAAGLDSFKWFVHLVAGATIKRIPLPSGELALDPNGTRIAILDDQVIRLVRFDNTPMRTIDLGITGKLTRQLTIDGDRLLLGCGTLIRVVDLATGAISPEGIPPFGGSADQVVVRDDGAALTIGLEAWRVVDGRVTAKVPVGRDVFASAVGDLGRFVSIEDADGDEDDVVTLRSIDSRTVVRRWQLGQPAVSGWLGSDGNVGIDGFAGNSRPSRILRTDGDRVIPVVSISIGTNVRDIDLDGGFALLQHSGTVHILRLSDAKPLRHTLRVPRCDSDARAALERGGSRIVAWHDRDLILWSRTNGAMLGAARFDEPVTAALPVRDRDEVLVIAGRTLALWAARAGELRSVTLPGPAALAISPDARRIALGFASGRLAVVELAGLRAALPLSSVTRAKVPARCGRGNPLDEGEPISGPDDD